MAREAGDRGGQEGAAGDGEGGDRVDRAGLRKPYHWNIAIIRRFMVHFGLISTFFDFVTFGVLWWLTAGHEALFRTGWFVESLLSELLVLLVIRTALPAWPRHVLASLRSGEPLGRDGILWFRPRRLRAAAARSGETTAHASGSGSILTLQ